MRNPAGRECPYFYGDYYRGRQREECRLLNSASLAWQPSLCFNCPVPAVTSANSCEHMQFRPSLKKTLPIIGKSQVSVEVYCLRSERPVPEPRVGCGQCHSLPDAFIVLEDELD